MSQLSIRTVETIAIEINSIKDQVQQTLLQGSIEIGRRLVEAKGMLPHGSWGNWLGDYVDYSQSTANNLMKIFENYGSNQLTLFGDNAKSQAIANLTYTQAVALIGIPEKEREEFIENNKVDEMSTRELQAAVKERTQALKDKEIAERAAAEAVKREEKERKLREKLELQQKDHEIIVKRLNDQIEEARTAHESEGIVENSDLEEALKKSESDLMESQVKIKRLEDQLKAKPIDIPAVIEKVPDEVLKELEELRNKVASGTTAEAAVFKTQFDSLNDSFSNVLTALDAVRLVDPELHTKYKGAVSKLIGIMSEQL
ncbi:DUF3102 domain-containing protein [Paenibacillus sp. FSL K6-0276]|uniref:DUF3102 domain-containing protein n=1 Tax=Paenibacillus sp. FSL K6-0276 TaxID=2921450 RepID=UPI0030ECAB5C